MKITTLIENTTGNPALAREHGLSFLIQTGDKTILFDSGQSGNFIRNAKEMGIDLKDVDIAVLSHGHYDHGGGMLDFLKENTKAKIYMNEKVFGDFYHNEDKYIGLNKKLKDSDRIIFIKDEYFLDEGIRLSSCNSKAAKYPIDTSNLFKKEKENFIPEDFSHEHYLEIEENGKKVLFSGCSHKGILNIADWFQPDILIGGFHFMEIGLDESGRERLELAAKELKGYDTTYYTCHCTGKKQFAFLKELMGNQLHYLSTGDSLEI